jgi:hypothetical protein
MADPPEEVEPPWLMTSEEHALVYRRLREERPEVDRNRWVYLLKELRVTHNCSIYDAERIALADPVWKRWVERQINTDQRCQRMARYHLRRHGEAALVAESDGKLIVR